MRFLLDKPLPVKLSIITLISCSAVLFLSLAALFVREIIIYKKNATQELNTTAKMLGGFSSAALVFNDDVNATDMLAHLRNEPHITMAVLYRENRPFAAYRRADLLEPFPSAPPDLKRARFFGDDIELLHDVHLGDEAVGSIYLRADLSQFRRNLWEYFFILSGVFLITVFLVHLLMTKMHHVITAPIFSLRNAARQISEAKDYGLRVRKPGRDELGELTETFNLMLDRIQEKDRSLQESRDRFEIAVMGSSDGLWDWDLVAQTVYFSPRWKEMIGYGPDEFESTYENWIGRIHPDDRGLMLNRLEAYWQGGVATFEIEYRLQHKNGHYPWILSRGAALRDAEGRPLRMAGSHTDITPRKVAEEKMEEMNRQLIEASRHAGKAEVATGILHNVGNVLNSINVSVTVVADHIRADRSCRLSRIGEMVEKNRHRLVDYFENDPKGRLLPSYLMKLAAHAKEANCEILQELSELIKNVEHIKQVVSMQQNYAKVSGMKESVQARDLMEDAYGMVRRPFDQNHIHIERDYESVPPVLVDRHTVLQILVNLLNNAKHALVASSAEQRIVRFRIHSHNQHSPGTVLISVQDNGCGIAIENLNRVFAYGFTTKEDGHGFGLHSGALAAKQLGGSLKVSSEGINQGAIFTLELPTDSMVSTAQAA